MYFHFVFVYLQMDDLFDDDEDAAPAKKEESRADKMAAAKKAKDAKKKIDRWEGGAIEHRLSGSRVGFLCSAGDPR